MLNPNALIARLVQQPALAGLASILMRAGLALIFIVSGFGKLTAYAATVGYMQAMGVPSAALPVVILIELGGGLAILLGLQTRFVAGILAGFCIITAFLFHGAADQVNQIMFLKNFAMAGGFIALVLFGAGRLSIDRE